MTGQRDNRHYTPQYDNDGTSASQVQLTDSELHDAYTQNQTNGLSTSNGGTSNGTNINGWQSHKSSSLDTSPPPHSSHTPNNYNKSLTPTNKQFNVSESRAELTTDVNGSYDKDNNYHITLPASGLRLFGATWALGAEDMVIPAGQSVITDLLTLSLAAASLQFYRIGQFDIQPCQSDNKSILFGNLIAYVVLWSCITANDMGIAVSGYMTTMFKKNHNIAYLMYARMTLSLLLIALAIESVYMFAAKSAYNCTSALIVNGNNNNTLYILYLATIALSFVKSYLFIGYSYFSMRTGRYFTAVDSVRCSRRIYKLVRTFYDRDKHGDPEILESIAQVFTEFFGGPSARGSVTPSDVLTGFAMVEALQRVRKANGHKFKRAAPYDRWKKVQTGQVKVQPSGFESSAYSSQSDGAGGNGKSTHNAANGHSNGHRNALTSQQYGEHDHPIHAIDVPVAGDSHHGEPDPNVDDAELANDGIQPALWPEDWERIAEAKHFGKYAFGAYGWLLYWMDHWICCMTCKTARFATRSHVNTSNMIGSGIGTGKVRFCQWSVNAFLITTGIKDADLLYCHIIGSPVYYVAVDRQKKSLIVSIRGSLSISDGIADLDAKLISLDQYGIQGGITHKGLFKYALRAIDDIEERGIVEEFMSEHPDYQMRIVGHSLGAAIAPIITLLWKNRYPHINIRCIAYAPPHLFNIELAESDWMLEHVTSIVAAADLVPRLSLSALWRLKNQMIYCFQICHHSKFQVVNGAMNKQLNRVFLHEFNQEQYDMIVNKPMEKVSKMAKKELEETGEESDEQQPDYNKQQKAKPNGEKDNVGGDASRGFTAEEFQLSLRPTYLPGRLYHILPLKRSLAKARQADYVKKHGRIHAMMHPLPHISTIYAAHQDTFREIWVSRRMFLDHLPDVYTFDAVPTHPQHSKTSGGDACNDKCCTKHPRYI